MFPFDENGSSKGEKDPRKIEFMNLGPITETDARKERIDRDKEIQETFVKHGDELWDLRKSLKEISHKLVEAMTSGSKEAEERVRRKLRAAEKKDPEIMYEIELLEMNIAASEARTEDAREHTKKAMAARSCLPQYNLDGLWVGKYGKHGYEMINVTYFGDTLIATKVTGDKNVPMGEISFQADLTPMGLRKKTGVKGKVESPLDPITLTNKAAKKWGTSQLTRYGGLGQVAKEGFINNKWIEGQLIIIGENYFSFAWVPLEQQIFFGRPSPELTMKMLRDGGVMSLRERMNWEKPPSIDEDTIVLKEYVTSCLDKTEEKLDDELAGVPNGCIWHSSDAEECYFE